MDRTEIERLLEQLNAEREALQSRLTTVTKAADGLQALLEMTPGPAGWTSVVVAGTVYAGNPDVVRESLQAVPAAQRPAEETPKGMEAAQLILESDTSRQWTVRDVSDEQIRLGWAAPRPRGAKGNPPARAGLDRLLKAYPQNVKVVRWPVLAYQWIPDPSPSLNGSGAPHAEEVSS